MAEKRVNYSSGAPLEEKVGYSRMVKVGDHIYVGGTTSVQPDARRCCLCRRTQCKRYISNAF